MTQVYEMDVFKELLMKFSWSAAECADLMNDMCPIDRQLEVLESLIDSLDSLAQVIPDLYLPQIQEIYEETKAEWRDLQATKD